MYNIRGTHKNLSFCRSSPSYDCLVESLSVDGSFLPRMLGKGLDLSCQRSVGSKARLKQFSFQCTNQITNLACGSGKKFSLLIRTNQTHRFLGWTHMQSQSCHFFSAVAVALNNTTTSHHIELKDLCTLLKHTLA